MHLSPLSGCFMCDGLDYSGLPRPPASRKDRSNVGQAHRDGLLRGLALLGVLGMLFGFALISSAIHSDAAAYPTAFPDDPSRCAVAAR